MMSEPKGPVVCAEVRALLPAFLADEIPSDQSLRVQEHLDSCPPCRRFHRFETAFDGALKRGMRREAAPPSLVLAVHERLAAEDAGRAGRLGGLLARPWVRWAAAAAAVLVLAIPTVLLVRRGVPPGPPLVSAEVERVERGILVCGGCELRSVPAERQRGCRAFGHHAMLRSNRGALWQFVESDASRPLLTAADHYGDEVEVRGVFLNDLGYVKVKTYHFLAPERGADSGL